MTTREKIQERIAKMDEAVLPELLEHIDKLERVHRILKRLMKPKDEAVIAQAEA